MRWRRTVLVVEAVMAIAGAAGAIQLVVGVATPPVHDLPPGLHSWVLPGLWLFASVSAPATVAAVSAYRGDRRTPVLLLVANGLLATELLVQIPFIGLSWLQLGCGLVAVAMSGVAGVMWRDASRRARGSAPATGRSAAPPLHIAA